MGSRQNLADAAHEGGKRRATRRGTLLWTAPNGFHVSLSFCRVLQAYAFAGDGIAPMAWVAEVSRWNASTDLGSESFRRR